MGHSRTFIVKSSVILNALRVEGVMDDSVVKPQSGKPVSLEFRISSFKICSSAELRTGFGNWNELVSIGVN